MCSLLHGKSTFLSLATYFGPWWHSDHWQESKEEPMLMVGVCCCSGGLTKRTPGRKMEGLLKGKDCRTDREGGREGGREVGR